jgi:flagellar basal body-associated protein FliL
MSKNILLVILAAISALSLGLWIYTLFSDHSPFNKDLCKAIVFLSAAGAFHFNYEEQKKNDPEKYNKKTHLTLVGIWGFLGLMAALGYFFK